MRLRIAAALLTTVMALTAVADHPIDAAARREIGAKMADALENMYVIPEKGKALAAQVRNDFAAGRFDSATTAGALAAALNQYLEAADDRHLYVRYEGGPASASRERQRGTPRNHGFRAVQRLEPNIGYVDMGMFVDGDEAQALADAAMAFVHGTDAVIIDVRDCPGGSPHQVSYLASYFFGPEPVALMNRYHRPSNRTMQSTTTDVRGRRMPDVPLFLLTSGKTGSACESFAFTLQQHGRARVVGERTGGGGYNNAFVPLGHGLAFSVSVGTATHPKTGKQFQGVGVQPDIPAPAPGALEAARAAAAQMPSADKSTRAPASGGHQ